MELEHLIKPYVESLINQSLQEIESSLDLDKFSDEEDIQLFLNNIGALEDELNVIGGVLSPQIKDKINEITKKIRPIDTLGEDE